MSQVTPTGGSLWSHVPCLDRDRLVDSGSALLQQLGVKGWGRVDIGIAGNRYREVADQFRTPAFKANVALAAIRAKRRWPSWPSSMMCTRSRSRPAKHR